MLFNSFEYAIFLTIVFGLYWSLPHKYRWPLLFVASYLFYMSWGAKCVILIFFTTVVSYTSALLIEKQKNKRGKNIILTIAAIICLGIVFFYKYFNFLSISITNLLNFLSIEINPITLNIILPAGISFYTFQTLSYVIDVYRGDIKAERHFGYYATYVSFFPQLVAGPIERTKNLLPQIKAQHTFNYEQATYGLKIMAWGYFKKIVIADTLSQYVSQIFASPEYYQGFTLILATVFRTILVYCDFSGYSDIAIGTAKLMGINLMTNFKSPFFSTSIKEFWSRWHISLSTWFKDYVYIPLGGSRVSKVRHKINIFITFVASGIWHGANWTYIVWGGIHGLAQIIESMLPGSRNKNDSTTVRWLKNLLVFCFLTFAEIFIASSSIKEAIYIIGHLFNGISNPIKYVRDGFLNIGMRKIEFAKICTFIGILGCVDYLSLKHDCIEVISRQRTLIRYLVYIILLTIIIFFRSSNPAEFVYFQF